MVHQHMILHCHPVVLALQFKPHVVGFLRINNILAAVQFLEIPCVLLPLDVLRRVLVNELILHVGPRLVYHIGNSDDHRQRGANAACVSAQLLVAGRISCDEVALAINDTWRARWCDAPSHVRTGRRMASGQEHDIDEHTRHGEGGHPDRFAQRDDQAQKPDRRADKHGHRNLCATKFLHLEPPQNLEERREHDLGGHPTSQVPRCRTAV
mmetsp:Transcript_63409/g.183705  ORF Transcript_63409/g.183705 Transcript_63409/m.183705 type:complete len:210 (+) Transcript_63409:1697-2326(+)